MTALDFKCSVKLSTKSAGYETAREAPSAIKFITTTTGFAADADEEDEDEEDLNRCFIRPSVLKKGGTTECALA